MIRWTIIPTVDDIPVSDDADHLFLTEGQYSALEVRQGGEVRQGDHAVEYLIEFLQLSVTEAQHLRWDYEAADNMQGVEAALRKHLPSWYVIHEYKIP